MHNSHINLHIITFTYVPLWVIACHAWIEKWLGAQQATGLYLNQRWPIQRSNDAALREMGQRIVRITNYRTFYRNNINGNKTYIYEIACMYQLDAGYMPKEGDNT